MIEIAPDLSVRSPVIPIVGPSGVDRTVAAARAVAAAGCDVIEVTLRSPEAVEAIAAVRRACPDMVVAAGTVLAAGQVDAVRAAGASFVVSPGTATEVLDRCAELGLPCLPGVATPTEAMAVVARGIRVAKFFPALPSGGTAWLKAMAPVLPGLVFCPTGGITPANMGEFLALPNVPVVGGSWMLADPDPARIRAAMEAALSDAEAGAGA